MGLRSGAGSSTKPAGPPPSITGTSGTLVRSTTMTLAVTAVGADLSIAASPPSQSVTRGQSTTYKVTVTALNGFSGTVSFRVRGLPRHATTTFSPTLPPPGPQPTISTGGQSK